MIFYLHVCLCDMCLLGAHKGQSRMLDFLELELQVMMSRHVGAKNQTWVL